MPSVGALLALLAHLVASEQRCAGRLDARWLPRPHLCRQLSPDACEHFFHRVGDTARPCGDWRRDGACTAGPPVLCDKTPRGLTPATPQIIEARQRRRRAQRRLVLSRLGEACSSGVRGDVRLADCEGWCDRGARTNTTSSLAPCKFCKCRACRACVNPTLPKWATHTIAGVRASCALFGAGICNATGNLSATIGRVQAAAYARWQFNHTHQWIDALFAATYRVEGEVHARQQADGSAPRMVAAEEGLGEEEMAAMRGEAGVAPPGAPLHSAAQSSEVT